MYYSQWSYDMAEPDPIDDERFEEPDEEVEEVDEEE